MNQRLKAAKPAKACFKYATLQQAALLIIASAPHGLRLCESLEQAFQPVAA